MKFFRLLTLFLLFFNLASLEAGQTRETVTFHNDNYNMTQSYYPNSELMKRTTRDMKVLASRTHNRVYSYSSGLIAQLRRSYITYFKIGSGLAKHYEKKWGLRHYQSMNDEWKDKTFLKHRAKVKQAFLLFTSSENAFNEWNKSRNKAVKISDKKEMNKAFIKANKQLKKEIDYLKKLGTATFKDLENEIEMLGIKVHK
ncbi:hypothetical protein KAH37_09865 [bacterium]|nr:hypothetical protein [bacterium]